jgi:16S rRNA A1518/A1519 N6-dimethyltransferase RsmA/KsgA/DIM1 with predicted DNA glycosylase/AP lyase activity
MGKDEIEKILEKAAIDPSARAEELSLQGWYRLVAAIE